MPLRAQIHRERAAEQVVVFAPTADDPRRKRRCRPRIHHIGIGDEAIRPAALILGVTGRDVIGRVDGKRILLGQQTVVVHL